MEFYIQPNKTITNVPVDCDGWWVSGELAEKINRLYPFFRFRKNKDGKLLSIVDDKKAREAFELKQREVE